MLISNNVNAAFLFARQILMSELALANPVDMENIVVRCGEQVLELLDRSDEAGIEEIVENFQEMVRKPPTATSFKQGKQL